MKFDSFFNLSLVALGRWAYWTADERKFRRFIERNLSKNDISHTAEEEGLCIVWPGFSSCNNIPIEYPRFFEILLRFPNRLKVSLENLIISIENRTLIVTAKQIEDILVQLEKNDEVYEEFSEKLISLKSSPFVPCESVADLSIQLEPYGCA